MTKQETRKRSAPVLGAITGLFATTLLAALPDFSGRPIVDLIEALRDQGQRIVYSGDVLPARLRVTAMPATDNTLAALREVLAAHGLGVETGPRETWLIVRRGPAPAAPSAGVTAARPTPIRPALETIVVTASRYPIERRSAVSASSFSRHALETTPALGQDPLRVTHRLPGVTSDELTSEMHIRGGNLDEVLLTLDGVRLYSPYHLKDFQNVFSSINPRIVESMDVRTGGYEAQFGDRMGGVIAMQSIRPTEFRHHELGMNLLETDVLSSGLFGNGGGSWVTSLRRGNLDILSDAGDSGIGTPQYTDFFNRLDFELTPGLRLVTGALSLDDKISLNDGLDASAAADYDDSYVWVTLTRDAASGLESTYRIASASLERKRKGTIDDAERVTGSLDQEGAFDRLMLAADWTYQPTAGIWLSWGAEIASMELEQGFESVRTNLLPMTSTELVERNAPPASAAIRLEQTKRAVYLSLRYQPFDRVVAEIGLRRNEQTLTGENQTDPRLGLLFDVGDRTSLRAAWGRYSQSDSLAELALADGQTSLQPAKESRHFILGLEHMFGATGLLRVEVYEKRARNLDLRFENLFERVSLLPELLPDRFRLEPTRANTRGIEISLEGGSERLSWWANMALSRTQEYLPAGRFRRSWDERRSVKAGGEWSGSLWTVTGSLGHRSGWPISQLGLESGVLVASGFNSIRLPNFASFDLRASRAVEVAHGALNWYFEVSNLFDHANRCCLDYSVRSPGGGAPDELVLKYDQLLGIVPNVGIRWEL